MKGNFADLLSVCVTIMDNQSKLLLITFIISLESQCCIIHLILYAMYSVLCLALLCLPSAAPCVG